MRAPSPTYVLDSFALLALFREEPGADAVDNLLRRAQQGEVRLAMTAVNMGEVVYRTIRERGNDAADEALARMTEFTLEIVDIDRVLAIMAARLKGLYRMSYADCLAAALSQQLDAPVVTGDADFKQVEDLVAIEWLPASE